MKWLKVVFFGVGFVLISTFSHAQIEVKTNPVLPLFKTFPLKVEYLFNPDWGAELGGRFGLQRYSPDNANSGLLNTYGGSLAVKHYFMPSAQGGDRFYALLYDKFRYWEGGVSGGNNELQSRRNTVGLALGYKWLSRRHLIFETAVGGGKATLYEVGQSDFSSVPLLNWDVYWRMDIGYRF